MTKFQFQPMMIFCLLLIIFITLTNSLHPIYFIIMLLFYAILICLIMSLWKFTYIYSIMMFMIMISGLLIIFMYFASLISNEQNKMTKNTLLFMNMSLNSIFFLWIMNSPLQSNLMFMPYTSLEMNHIFKINIMPFQNITEIYNHPYFNITMLSMFFLLISLFLMIKITSIKTSSLRKIQ